MLRSQSSSLAFEDDGVSDVTGIISGLYVYPIKSCGGVAVQESVLGAAGLTLDRAFMLVDAEGDFVSQRELPRMALVQPQFTEIHLTLSARAMQTTRIGLAPEARPAPVRVWNDVVPAHDMGDAAAEWFSLFLGQALRLMRFDTRYRRLSNLKWTGGIEAPNQFSDGYPLLVVGTASLANLNERLLAGGHEAVGMARFRPNIVIDGLDPHDEDRIDSLQIAALDGEIQLKLVKPCSRCPIPDIDPATAVSTPVVSDILRSYRQDARVDGAITFGMNAIVLQGAGAVLTTGSKVQAAYQFD